MLTNGIISCEIRNTPTHKYAIKREDVLSYIAKSPREKRKEIPVGLFNAKKNNNPHENEQEGSVCEGYFDDTVLTLRGAEKTKFKQTLETLLADVPDTLTVQEVAEITGYADSTINPTLHEPQIHIRRENLR